eukprot:6213453-Pleurochrysis_carterae.AAC.2
MAAASLPEAVGLQDTSAGRTETDKNVSPMQFNEAQQGVGTSRSACQTAACSPVLCIEDAPSRYNTGKGNNHE